MSIGNYLLQEKNHLELRRYLLAYNFFVKVLVLYLRKRLDIPDDGLGDTGRIINWLDEKNTKLYKEHGFFEKKFGNKSGERKISEQRAKDFEVEHELFQPLFDVVQKFNYLDLDPQLIKFLVLGETDFYFPTTKMVHRVTSSKDPIVETGVYIKYNPYLTDREFKNLRSEAQDSYRVLRHFYPNLPEIPIENRRKTNKIAENYLKLYIAIQEHHFISYKNKPKYCSLDNTLQEVAKVEKLKVSTLEKVYLKVQNEFALPKITEVSKIHS